MNTQIENGKKTEAQMPYGIMSTSQRQNSNTSYSSGDLTARLDATSATYGKAPMGNQMSSSAPKPTNGSTPKEMPYGMQLDELLKRILIPFYGANTQQSAKATDGKTGIYSGLENIAEQMIKGGQSAIYFRTNGKQSMALHYDAESNVIEGYLTMNGPASKASANYGAKADGKGVGYAAKGGPGSASYALAGKGTSSASGNYAASAGKGN